MQLTWTGETAKLRAMKTLAWMILIACSTLMGGCAWMQSSRRPMIAVQMAQYPWAMDRLVETGQTAVVEGSEITVLVPPATPAAYWACLQRLDHRDAEVAEIRRWSLPVRWRPTMPAGHLHLPTRGGTWLTLSADGADQGRVNGVPILGPVEHLANGNLVRLAAPLPPLPDNPCSTAWSASVTPTP